MLPSTNQQIFVASTILFNLHIGFGFTVPEIINKSKTAIVKQLTGANRDVLEEHFFTKNKNLSIWNAAQKARDEITHQTLMKKSAKLLENGLRDVHSHFKNCSKVTESKEKVKCWINLAKLLTSINKGMNVNESWSSEVNYGIYYNAYALMVYHIAVIATNDLKLSHGESVGRTVGAFTSNDQEESSFYPLVQTINDLLDDIDLGIRTWRLIQITPVIICDATEVFWQTFYENCQPSKIKLPMIIKELTEKESDNDKKNENEMIVDEFGTNMKSGTKKYYISVRDKVKDVMIVEKYMIFKKNVRNIKKTLSAFMDSVMSKKVKRERSVKKMLNTYSEIYYDSVNEIGNYLVSLVR